MYFLSSILSLIFLLALYNKIKNINGYKQDISTYLLINRKGAGLLYIPVLASEFLLFILFAFNELQPFTDIFAIVVLIAFTTLLIWKWRRTGTSECSCFGDMKFLNISPIMRNILLIILCLINTKYHTDPYMLSQGLKNICIVCVTLYLMDTIQDFNKIKQLRVLQLD